jgi:uncharacterized protein (DUF58 family)
MLTSRGWWLLLALIAMLGVGAWGPIQQISLIAIALLIWYAWEWIRFVLCIRIAVPAIRLEREVWDARGPVGTLWEGRTFDVHVTLRFDRELGRPFLFARDAVPFGVDVTEGEYQAAGFLRSDETLSIQYTIRCTAAGLTRFEGVRVQLADLQGLFYHPAFVRAPAEFRVLPVLTSRRSTLASTKRVNELPPPGVHRLRRPGSGSELLDLRDYMPGDPPKTIAWKISARRDRLITKEFESEVPIRCTLFLDTSASVRVPALCPPSTGEEDVWRPGRALDRLIEIAAGVVQANALLRDLTVLCLFDEHASTIIKPDRTGPRLTQMLHRLADAAALVPIAARVDPELLLSTAYSFAHEVYPDLLARDVNSVPAWLNWFVTFPGQRRTRPGMLRRLYRHRLMLFLSGFLGVPLLSVLVYAATVALVVFTRQSQDTIAKTIGRGLAITAALSALSVVCSTLFFLVSSLLGERLRRSQSWRKRLAALLAVHYGPVPGGLAALLEDDDQFSLLVQRFLGEHRVPYALPLYDADGRYLFSSSGKISVLANTLTQAVGRGRDNELFVLLADVLELDQDLEPLLRAVKVALARHHQVMFVCPWPPTVPLPDSEPAANGPTWVMPSPPDAKPLPRGLAPWTTGRFQAAYERARKTFGRIGVQVVCAATEQPVALILERIERLRRLRRVH